MAQEVLEDFSFEVEAELEEKQKIEKAKEVLKVFLKEEDQSLATFTKERRLGYEPKEELEVFSFDAKTFTLNLPLKYFMEEEFDHQMILFSIYETLALYPDWKKYPEVYLNRMEYFSHEVDHLAFCLYKKIKQENLQDDEEYNNERLISEAQTFVGIVLLMLDHLYRYLRVLELCPIYRNSYYQKEIQKEYININLHWMFTEEEKLHEKIMDGFIMYAVHGIDGCKDASVRKLLLKQTLGKPFGDFVIDHFKQMIHDESSVLKRDEFTKVYIMPCVMKVLEDEIEAMPIHKGSSKQKGEGQGGSFEKNARVRQGLQEDDQEELLERLQNEKRGNQIASEEIRKGKIDLSKYKVTDDDQTLFNVYANAIQPQRMAMKAFWVKLIGDAKKEESYKRPHEPKGRLNVNTVIQIFPDFVEDQMRGNYNNLKIYDRYYLRPVARKLPKQIDISFIVDNSGSMADEKIDAARKALALTLLSLQDFDDYLKYNAEQLKQRIEVNTEVFYFGTGFDRVKRFDDKKEPAKNMASTIGAITRMDGLGGATDDGGCLMGIARRIGPEDVNELASGKRIHLVFEITDGASSFPRLAREAVERLLKNHVEVFSFMIGEYDEEADEIFHNVFIEGFNEPCGVTVYEQVEKLPELLLSATSKKLSKIFKGN